MASNFTIPTLLSLLLLILSTIHADPYHFSKPLAMKKPPKQKLSHLHFYFHDILSGRSPTAVPLRPPLKPLPSAFGMVNIMDDPLTLTPELNSTLVGQAQGIYAAAGQQELGFLQAMNLVFTYGKYNGSVLTVLGRNPALHPVREMPVVGGSGLFRFATGYALAHTHWLDAGTGDAVVEYNVYVMHY